MEGRPSRPPEPEPQEFPALRALTRIVVATTITGVIGAGLVALPGLTPMVIGAKVDPPEGSPIARAPIGSARVVVTSPYGPRGLGFHSGLDLRAREGAPLVSVADGVVERVGRSRRGGNTVVVKLDSGWHAGYAHLSR